VCTAGRYIREASLVRSASSVPLDFGHQLSVQDQRQVARHGKCGVLDSSLSFGRWLFLTVSAFFAKLCHAADQSGCRASRAGAQQAEHVRHVCISLSFCMHLLACPCLLGCVCDSVTRARHSCRSFADAPPLTACTSLSRKHIRFCTQASRACCR